MKKIIILIIIIVCIGVGFYLYKVNDESVKILDIETEKVKISEYYTYGTYLNMAGSVKLDKNNFKSIKLVLYNGEFKEYDINYTEDVNTINFNLSELLNDGIYLEDINRGKYNMFIRVNYKNEENKDGEDISKYYILENNTDYKETIYYTMSIKNNKVTINTDDFYKTMTVNVIENDNKNIYDIVIDPGHGGMDGGAESKNKEYHETDFTLSLAKSVKKELEKLGLKVKLTHDEDTLTKNELLEEYGEHGRAVVSSEVKAKYLISLHFNSNDFSSVSGLETYSAVGINYDFIKDMVKNITTSTGLKTSTAKKYKIFDGVYSKNFSKSDIENSYNGYEEKGLNKYDITEKSNYYYMIRETGGIVTGAYVDDRNEKILANPYVLSNTGCESYILELGYITNSNDLDIIVNKQDKFVEGIVKTFSNYLKLENNVDKNNNESKKG